MWQRIKLLSPLLANQIAAGEVIERPASVLKELLENSLDAGATRVEITLEKGGKQLIRIQDNGCGIHPDDMALALSRHATSKISQLNDLAQLTSLGFRGEALASIAAVSRLVLISAQADSSAQQISVEGETQQPHMSAAAHPCGTTVTVAELFFNAPVRRRFLRTDKTEFAHCLDVIKRIALSRPELAIKLIHNEKLIFQLSPGDDLIDQSQRIAKICGKHFINNSRYFTQEAEGLVLQGWVNNSDASYPHTDLQYFYLNGRMVRDKLINHALRIAAQEWLPPGRYPAYVLYFTCEPHLVDVNVHPTKHEVRFQESRLMHDFLVRALQRAWSETETFIGIEEEQAEYNPKAPFVEEKPSKVSWLTEQSNNFKKTSASFLNNESAYVAMRQAEKLNMPGKFIACAKNNLLLETSTGLLIINCCEALQKTFLAQLLSNDITSKPLLIPITINLSSAQLTALENKKITWKDIGIIWQTISTQQIIVRQLPGILRQADVQALFITLCDSHDVLQTIAEFAALAYMKEMTDERIKNLLTELEKFSSAELEKISRHIEL